MNGSMNQPFLKMHGTGNDFVIFDGRTQTVTLSAEQIKSIAERRTGVGCDQVIVMENPPVAGVSDVWMRIFNADGGEVSSCGNATRCVAWIVMQETGKQHILLETKAGKLACDRVEEYQIRVDMGEPKFEWQQIPLSEPRDTLHLGISLGDLSDPVAVSMGNPHAVFLAGDVERLRIRDIGPALEHYPLFPERANISFAQPVGGDKVKLRVWERGVGETLSCGTAACATLVALNRRKLLDDKGSIMLPGGTLDIEWNKTTNHVWMTGAVAVSFSGLLDL